MREYEKGQKLEPFCQSGDAVFIVNSEQRITSWNKGAERMFLYSESEVLDRHCYEVLEGRVHPDLPWCRAGCKVRECAMGLTPMGNFDLLARTKDGRRVWTNVSVISTTEKKPVTLHLMRDVTMERKTGEAINQLLSALGIPVPVPNRRLPEANPEVPAAGVAAVASGPSAILSPREIEVLRLQAEGLSTKAVAERLNISPFTARNHMQNILAKLHLHNKTQAVSFAFKHGLL
jgi:PAS domain S-box-containing protein